MEAMCVYPFLKPFINCYIVWITLKRKGKHPLSLPKNTKNYIFYNLCICIYKKNCFYNCGSINLYNLFSYSL